MEDAIVAYCAGFFDGEGSVGISKRKSKSSKRGYALELVVQISNTNKAALLLFQHHFGGWLMSFKSQSGRVIWRYGLGAKKAQALLEKLLPHLRIKRNQAVSAIEFQKNKKHCNRKTEAESLREMQIRKDISVMNVKGKRPAFLASKKTGIS